MFIVLTVGTLGAAALLYVALWWALPQESLIARRRASPSRVVAVIVLVVVMVGVWIAQYLGWLQTSGGQELFWPVILLVLSAVFFLRQVRG
jgi:hypothetical protein